MQGLLMWATLLSYSVNSIEGCECKGARLEASLAASVVVLMIPGTVQRGSSVKEALVHVACCGHHPAAEVLGEQAGHTHVPHTHTVGLVAAPESSLSMADVCA